MSFPAGKKKASFAVPIMDDKIMESNEKFQLSIISNSLPDRVIVTDYSNTIVTITDNDGGSY